MPIVSVSSRLQQYPFHSTDLYLLLVNYLGNYRRYCRVKYSIQCRHFWKSLLMHWKLIRVCRIIFILQNGRNFRMSSFVQLKVPKCTWIFVYFSFTFIKEVLYHLFFFLNEINRSRKKKILYFFTFLCTRQFLPRFLISQYMAVTYRCD